MQVGDVTTVEEMTNITVSGDDLRYTCKYTVMKNGEVIDALRPYQLHCVKVHDDYYRHLRNDQGTVIRKL